MLCAGSLSWQHCAWVQGREMWALVASGVLAFLQREPGARVPALSGCREGSKVQRGARLLMSSPYMVGTQNFSGPDIGASPCRKWEVGPLWVHVFGACASLRDQAVLGASQRVGGSESPSCVCLLFFHLSLQKIWGHLQGYIKFEKSL